jgi:hypothetical protein
MSEQGNGRQPQKGDRVRVVAISDRDPDPHHEVGDVVTLTYAAPRDDLGDGVMHIAGDGRIRSGSSFARVELVADESSTAPAPMASPYAGNPKDAIGARKAPLSPVSRRVMHELGIAMLEGECKYHRHNYRAAPVRAMVYLDAHDRHISAWTEGQDIDPKSGLSHLVKAMACLHVVRDAQIYGTLIDDRPPAQPDPNWLDELDTIALEMIDRLGREFVRGEFTEANRDEWPAKLEALRNGPIKVTP